MSDFENAFTYREYRPLIIAHRGAGHSGKGATTHENTMAAFEAALAAGADGVEVDVRRTSDGVMVIHHDRRLPGFRMPIVLMSYAEVRKAARSLGYCIPTLEEVVRFCSRRMLLDVELKEAGYEAEVVAACRKMIQANRVVFTSFDPDVVAAIKSVYPDSKVGFLVGLRSAGKMVTLRGKRSPLAVARDCGADFIALHWRLVTVPFCRRAEATMLPVVVWTVDRVSSALDVMKGNVLAIITNHPRRLGIRK